MHINGMASITFLSNYLALSVPEHFVSMSLSKFIIFYLSLYKDFLA